MMGRSNDSFPLLKLISKPAWTEVWHLWTVIMPRRSITGRLLYGKVWRRYDRPPLDLQKFVEYNDRGQN